MKKLSILLIMMILPLISCFQDVKTGVSIDLGILDSSIQKIHVLVMSESTILSKKSFDRYGERDPSLYLPSNEELSFIILGENSSNKIGFFGSKTLTVTGNDLTIAIAVEDISIIINPEYMWTGSLYEIRWDSVPGANLYVVYDENWGNWIKLYEGNDNLLQTTHSANYDYYVTAYFGSLDLVSTGEVAVNVGGP